MIKFSRLLPSVTDPNTAQNYLRISKIQFCISKNLLQGVTKFHSKEDQVFKSATS